MASKNDVKAEQFIPREDLRENPEVHVAGIRFLCEYRCGTPFSLNHIPPTPKWFSEAEFKAIPKEKFIPGLKAEIVEFFDKYKTF